MLALARALMARPRLLLLDEPSLGLAPMVVRRSSDRARAQRARGPCGARRRARRTPGPRRRGSGVRARGRDGSRWTGRAPSSATTSTSAGAISATDETTWPTSCNRSYPDSRRGDLRLARARPRADPSRDRRHQLRPGRDGDLLDLHRLVADREPRLAVLAGVRGHADALVPRRRRAPPDDHPARGGRLRAAGRDRHDRPAARAERPDDVDLVGRGPRGGEPVPHATRWTSAASRCRCRTSARSSSRSAPWACSGCSSSSPSWGCDARRGHQSGRGAPRRRPRDVDARDRLGPGRGPRRGRRTARRRRRCSSTLR